MNIQNTRGVISTLLVDARRSTKASLLNYTDRLLEQYSELSDQLSIVKGISLNWLSSLVNRKAMKSLIGKLRKIKRDIDLLIRSYSSFRTIAL